MTIATRHRLADVTTGDPVFVAVRKLMLFGAALAVAYAGLSNASQGFCSGPRDLITGAAEVCTQATMAPSPLVFIALVAVVYSAISRIAKGVPDRAAALAICGRRSCVMVAVVVVSLVVGHLWFWTVPVSIDFSQSHAVLYPVPFVVIDITTN